MEDNALDDRSNFFTNIQKQSIIHNKTYGSILLYCLIYTLTCLDFQIRLFSLTPTPTPTPQVKIEPFSYGKNEDLI